MTLFAKKNVHLGFMTASQTQAINPFYIMILAAPFSWLWVKLSKANKNPITPVKSSLGIAQLGLGFLVFALSANFMDGDGKVPLTFLLLGYFFMTTGELFISPIGLSKTSELAPAKIVSFMIGIFYLSSSFAHYIAGAIAKLTAGTGEGASDGIISKFVTMVTGFKGGVTDSTVQGVQSLATYTSVFAQIAFISFGAAIVVLILSPLIKKMMHGIN